MSAIRVGIGGWTFAPWRGTFYPPGLPAARELEHASRRVTAIEINGPFYRTQSPASFAKWRDAAPDGFVFSVKAARGATYTRDLAKAEAAIARFLSSGLTELGAKLGPILWQLAPTRTFDDGVAAFLALLPQTQDGVRLRHVVEARHASFASPEAVAALRARGAALAIVDSAKHRLLGDLTADVVYARLERNDAEAPEGYATPALDAWRARAAAWSKGEPAPDLPCASPAAAPARPRDVFLFFIGGDKQRAPDAASAMLARLAQNSAQA